jgi:tetratricopeptide (TPR) repeat protein
MKVYRLLLLVTCCLFLACPVRNVSGKDSWTNVRSANYLLLGNASETDIREFALQLEQFRHVFLRQFAGASLNSPVPTIVIVFKNDSSYRPYKPLFHGRPADVAGYFQSGHDVNYITLSAERRPGNPFAMIFHESVHLLVDNKLRTAPAWFNEGLAEYFSTFTFLPEEKAGTARRVVFGTPIVRHIAMLRQNALLPLATLFAVDRSSPYYNEREKSSMFYAQSWALIHYLTHGQAGRRQPQLARFLELLATGAPLAQSFQQAFETDFATIEKESKEYVRQDTYRVRLVPYAEPAGSHVEVKSTTLTEAEVLAYLGDMLLHTDRGEEADKHLRQALALAPDLSMAHASLGMLRVRQRNFDEAKQHLRRAIKADPQNYLAQYYYGFALSRESMDDGQVVTGYPPETAEMMRSALGRAIEIAPNFPEPYRLLAFVNLATNTRLDEAATLLERALGLSPGRHEFAFVLAQVQMRRKEYKLARATLEQIITGTPNRPLRTQAQEMLDEVAVHEKYHPKQ